MNLKRTLSAAVLAFALTMMPAFVACSPDDNKTDIEAPDKPENPDPEPEPEPNPNPEPEPNPEPGPNPEPSVTTGAKWFELPAVNAKEEGTNTLLMRKTATCTMHIIFALALRNMPTTGKERETTPYASAKVIIARYGWPQSGTTVCIR